MTHVSMQPQLEALRLEYVAALFDGAAARLGKCGEHTQIFGLADEDADQLHAGAKLVTWLAQKCRRFAIEVRAIDQMHAASWRGEPVVPDDASVFGLSAEPPPAPPSPKKLMSIDTQSLEPVRERLQEAQDVLRYGGSETARAAAGLAKRTQGWCGG